MSYSYTFEKTFTAVHAKHLAAKVATDLKRIQRFYDYPSDKKIDMYENEIIELLKGGYLDTVTYGFRRNGKWIAPTLRYSARDLAGASSNDDDPGKVRPGGDTRGAFFGSYLTYSAKWDKLSKVEREEVESRLPIQRNGAAEPGVEGYFTSDLTYSSGTRSLDRSTVKSY